MRWLVVLLLLANVLFFALMQWGGELGSEGKREPTLDSLNPEKIKLLDQPAPPPITVSAVSAVPAVAPIPAPVAPVTAVVPAVPPVVPAPAGVLPARAVEKNCMEWGEFSGTDLARAEKVLAQMKLGDKLGQRTVEYTRGYWVYIPPLKTHAGRVKKIQQLKELGVAEYFVVQEAGRWMNAISLGVFKTEESANNYLVELNKKGIKSARMGERVSKLKFTVFTFRHLDAQSLAQLTALQKDYAGSEVKMLACNHQ